MENNKIKLPMLSIIYILMFMIAVMNISDFLNSSMLVHIKSGEWILDNMKIPQNDIFAFGGTKEWINYYWLTDVVYAVLYRNFGIGSILILSAVLMASSFTVVSYFLYKKNVNVFLILLFLVVSLYSSLPQWSAVPYTFTLFFTVIYIFMLEKFYDTGLKKYILFISVLQIVWTNMNSEFFYPFVILFIYGITDLYGIFMKEKESLERIKKTAVLFCITIPLIFVNPYGIKEITNVFSSYIFLIKDRRNDWAAPDFHGFAKMSNILLAFSILMIGMFRKKSIKENRRYVLLYLVAVFVFLYAQRYIALYSVMTFYFVPMFLERDDRIKLPILNKFIDKTAVISGVVYNSLSGKFINLFLIFIITTIFFVNIRYSEHYFHEIISKWSRSAGVKYLAENKMYGRGFHSDSTGDMIIWYNYPKMKVFVDTREGVYEWQHQNKYGKIMQIKDDWEKVIKNEKIEWILLQKGTLSNILKLLKNDWKIEYEEERVIIFKKIKSNGKGEEK